LKTLAFLDNWKEPEAKFQWLVSDRQTGQVTIELITSKKQNIRAETNTFWQKLEELTACKASFGEVFTSGKTDGAKMRRHRNRHLTHPAEAERQEPVPAPAF
jgi:hypothetical protein